MSMLKSVCDKEKRINKYLLSCLKSYSLSVILQTGTNDIMSSTIPSTVKRAPGVVVLRAFLTVQSAQMPAGWLELAYMPLAVSRA